MNRLENRLSWLEGRTWARDAERLVMRVAGGEEGGPTVMAATRFAEVRGIPLVVATTLEPRARCW
jgi:hypothetical protein